MSYIVEPEKRVPVAYEVDVAVAGGGIAGMMPLANPDSHLSPQNR